MKAKRKRRLGITMTQFEAARDNTAIDCGEHFRKNRDVAVCEKGAKVIFEVTATKVQGGVTFDVTDIYRASKDKCPSRPFYKKFVCQQGMFLATKRIAQVKMGKR